MHASYLSTFDRVYDVAILGSGYVGFAAALELQARGLQVILVNPQADLVWESGRAFQRQAGTSAAPSWLTWMQELQQRGAATPTEIDGALAEIVATDVVARSGLRVLYYVNVVQMEHEGDNLAALLLATKSGVRRLVARQWVDATEPGTLSGMNGSTLRTVTHHDLYLYLQRAEWPAFDGTLASPLSLAMVPGMSSLTLDGWHLTSNDPEVSGSVQLAPTLWPQQAVLQVRLPGEWKNQRQVIIPLLRGLRELWPELMTGVVVSHNSLMPYPIYAANSTDAHVGNFRTMANVVIATPGLVTGAVETLAQRYDLGLKAAAALAKLPRETSSDALLRADIPEIVTYDRLTADVAVAGAGTGGAMAAIAAARGGAKTLCVDPLSFPGGIGTGGGIHSYYYGVPGGLQEEMDARVEAAMAAFSARAQCVSFHPEAKKLVLDEMMREAGVEFLPDTMVYGVQATDGTVETVDIADSLGGQHIKALQWIDATGDGDLAALAGAPFRFGRSGDGVLHAYSQSAGRMNFARSPVRMEVINFDAGWVDPTSSEDLTRARVTGIRQYLRDTWDHSSRVTYMAPAIGLRQGRHIETDYELTLADLIETRTFADSVGFTGAHYDNHAVDYEFESDEGLFWVWLLRQWRTRIHSDIPYRMLLPRGLSNVWIACRAAGMTQDAHQSMRMQRDIQRLGEIAGTAAALAVRHGGGSRQVPFAELRTALLASGALRVEEANREREFGCHMVSKDLEQTVSDADLEAGLEALRAGQPSSKLWHVYRHRARTEAAVLAALESPEIPVSWHAAAILAMWGDERAEERLIQSMRTRETGWENGPERDRPGTFTMTAPNWYIAVSLLRVCGTAATLPALADLAAAGDLWFSTRTAMAITLERLALRGVIGSSQRDAVSALLAILEQLPEGAGLRYPQRLFDERLDAASPTKPQLGLRALTWENHDWQLLLVTTRVRKALGLPVSDAALALQQDERALVRAAIAKALGA